MDRECADSRKRGEDYQRVQGAARPTSILVRTSHDQRRAVCSVLGLRVCIPLALLPYDVEATLRRVERLAREAAALCSGCRARERVLGRRVSMAACAAWTLASSARVRGSQGGGLC
eukprot:1513264-Pleurochrysis_carterae.AAC.3